MQFSQALFEIEQTKLSPNFMQINKQLQGNKDRLELV